jgi:hypothetical protein
MLIAPYLGYIASLLLIIALLVSNDLRFRWFNTAGNVFFISYALIIGAIPVLITNCILLGINALYLVKVYRRQENFDLIQFSGEEALSPNSSVFIMTISRHSSPDLNRSS